MAPRLSGEPCICGVVFFVFFWDLRDKRKFQSHVGILIYRTWPAYCIIRWWKSKTITKLDTIEVFSSYSTFLIVFRTVVIGLTEVQFGQIVIQKLGGRDPVGKGWDVRREIWIKSLRQTNVGDQRLSYYFCRRAMLDREGRGGERKEEIFFARPPPLSFLSPITHPLGRTFFRSLVLHCLKVSRWRLNFFRWTTQSARSKNSRLLCRLAKM